MGVRLGFIGVCIAFFSNFRGVGPNALGWQMKSPMFNVSNLFYPPTMNILTILPVFAGGIFYFTAFYRSCNQQTISDLLITSPIPHQLIFWMSFLRPAEKFTSFAPVDK